MLEINIILWVRLSKILIQISTRAQLKVEDNKAVHNNMEVVDYFIAKHLGSYLADIFPSLSVGD